MAHSNTMFNSPNEKGEHWEFSELALDRSLEVEDQMQRVLEIAESRLQSLEEESSSLMVRMVRYRHDPSCINPSCPLDSVYRKAKVYAYLVDSSDRVFWATNARWGIPTTVKAALQMLEQIVLGEDPQPDTR